MKYPSMRRNLLSLLALYAVSLVAAAGCPASYRADRPADGSATSRSATSPPAGEAREGTSAAVLHQVQKPAEFDPVRVNGRFFQNWEKPKLSILITGRQDGYLEPCGCAGLENQKGGIGRRHALIKDLEGRGWPVVAVDVGNLVRRFGRQAEIQFDIAAQAMRTMGYKGVGLGPADLKLSAGAVAAAAQENDVFVSANASVLGLTPVFRIVEAGGFKIGITAVVGSDVQQEVNNPEIEFQKPDAAIERVLGELRDCDYRILLASASLEESKRLAEKYSAFDVVVAGSGADEPPKDLETVGKNKTGLVDVGHKGMYAVVLGLYEKKPHAAVRYQRVALDSRYTGTPEMKQLMRQYQEHLHDVGWQGLEIRPMAHPKSHGGDRLAGKFVGASSCKECHPTAFAKWSTTKHAHATETLVKLDPPRQYDAECVSCHTTGWSPQEYFPYETGFDSLKTTPHLASNSCENCHGPGGAHVAAEKGKNLKKRQELRETVKLTTAVAQDSLCIKCHDLDNSPKFDFAKYWPQVEHKGKR